jgi:hypothetical protein
LKKNSKEFNSGFIVNKSDDGFAGKELNEYEYYGILCKTINAVLKMYFVDIFCGNMLKLKELLSSENSIDKIVTILL